MKTILIGIALVFLSAGCESDLTGVNEVKVKDETLPVIEILMSYGEVVNYEYSKLEYSNSRGGVLHITTQSGIISIPKNSFKIFMTTEANQHIDININGTGTLTMPYTSLHFSDRNVFTVTLNNVISAYGIEQLNNFNTYE